ncbi:MAG: DM13 domain-containing protein [Verrucomicrobiota bacterium]
MNNVLKIGLGILLAGGFAWLAFGFFGIQALFVNRAVEEEIPESVSSLISPSQADADAQGELLGKGSFQQGDSTYSIVGNVFMGRADGQISLTFTEFEVTNGPDLFVYAVKTNTTDNKTVKDAVANGDFLNLGALKGNLGNQIYSIENEFDSEEYQVISIWCRRFSRNFGSAKLEQSS